MAVAEETDVLRQRLADELVKVAQFPHFNPGPVLRLDADGNVLLANRAALAVFARESLIGECWLDICPGMNPTAWTLASAALAEPFSLDADLSDRCFTFRHVRAPGEDLVFVFGTDITARRSVERQLRDLARFPDMNPGPVLRMDLTSTVLLSNAAAQEVFGGDLVGRAWLDICPGLDADFWAAVLATTEVIPLEANVDGRIYLFSHRHDPQTQLVFVFGSDITKHKLTERALVQSERMATLGTLAAGVAHELNNPASATRRATEQLADALEKVDAAHHLLSAAHLGDAALDVLRDLEGRARSAADTDDDMTAVERSDAEGDIEEWLDGHGVSDGWDLAPALVSIRLDTDRLDDINRDVEPAALSAMLTFAARTVPVYALVREIGESSARISQIVNALKGYSFLGQAAAQDVDVHQGLDDTIVILGSRITEGIVVRRDYAADLPLLPGFGGELNQVWTHLIDNAVDAVGDVGEITITTRVFGGSVEVAVADDGPGVPPEVVSRIFDPFFTTKPQGKGTGLGLSTCHSIITSHHGGSIAVTSSPGDTRFTVRLPLEPPWTG